MVVLVKTIEAYLSIHRARGSTAPREATTSKVEATKEIASLRRDSFEGKIENTYYQEI